MNKINLLLIPLLIFVACEEVIEVELDNADPQIVIEANISDNSNNNLVTITKSTDFYKPSKYDSVTGAEIVVSELNGDSFTFSEVSSGQYRNETLNATIGSEYKITVNHGNVTYSANSKLHKQLTIDSLAVTAEKRGFSDELGYEFHCYFQDNLGIEDYARFRIYINGVRDDGIMTYEDRLTDGNYIDFSRFQVTNDVDNPLKPGDVITIELITIDKVIFEYFDTLRDVLASSDGGGISGGSTPAIPITNWDNDALGYFSGSTVDTMNIVIK